MRWSRKLSMERLEDRSMLAAYLSLDGAQTFDPGTNYNASDPAYVGSPVTDYDRDQIEMSLAVDPTNALNLAGISHRIDRSGAAPTRPEIDILFSDDGGVTWGRTIIGPGPAAQISDGNYPNGSPRVVNVIDDGYGEMRRFDPSIEFDSEGRLYVAYGLQDQQSRFSRLVVGKSLDGGRTFEDLAPSDPNKVLKGFHP